MHQIPPVQRREQHWQQQEWQNYRHQTGGHQHTHYSSNNGHLSSRHGLDVSRFAFGSILRDYTRAPTASPAMENVLNRFLEYDYGILTRCHSVSALLSPVSFDVIIIFCLCSINPTIYLGALQDGERPLSSTSSIVSNCRYSTAQLWSMQSAILILFIGYVSMSLHVQWI